MTGFKYVRQPFVLFVALLFGALPVEAQSELAAERHAREGFRLAQEGRDLARAEAELREAVRLAPGNIAYLSALGGVLAVQQEFEEAGQRFEQALRLQPNNLAIRRNLAAAQWQQGLLDSARDNLSLVLLADPRNEATVLLLGIVTAELEQCPKALELLESVMPLGRQRTESTLALAKCYYKTGKHARGQAALERLLEQPRHPASVFQGAAAAALAEDFETALRLFLAIRWMYDDRSILLYNIAYCQYRTSRFSEARATVRALVEEGRASSDVHSLIGWSYQQEGRLEEAVQAFRKAIEVDPRNEANYLDLATALMDDKRNPAALSVVQQAFQSVPSSTPLLEMRGLLETTLGHYIDAVESYSQASHLDPDDPDTHLRLAMSQSAAGNSRAGAETLKTGIERFPRHAPHYVEYGRQLLARGTDGEDEAEQQAGLLFRKAIELDGASPEARYEAGKLALEQGDYEQAVRHLETAAGLSPERSRVQHVLARAYVRWGKAEEAAEARKRFQSLKLKEDEANPRHYRRRRTEPTSRFKRGSAR